MQQGAKSGRSHVGGLSANAKHFCHSYPDGPPERPEEFRRQVLQLCRELAADAGELRNDECCECIHGWTVYTGVAGVAAMHLHLASRAALDAAERQEHAQRAQARAAEALPCCHCRGGVSFQLGVCGPHAVLAAASSRLGDAALAERHAARVAAAASAAATGCCCGCLWPRKVCGRRWQCGDMLAVAQIFALGWCPGHAPPAEVLFGQAGWLHAAQLVNRHLPGAVRESAMAAVASSIIARGLSYARSGSLRWALMGREYLGAAHGDAGILHALLGAPLSADQRELVLARTAELLHEAEQCGGELPIIAGCRGQGLREWCHGSGGAVFLFCRAHAVTTERRFLDGAVLCGERVWQEGLLCKGPSLCHGVAGSGYALLRLWRETEDARWLHRAQHFGHFLLSDWPGLTARGTMRTPDHPLSLYEGIAGTACFLADLLEPQQAEMPGFEP